MQSSFVTKEEITRKRNNNYEHEYNQCCYMLAIEMATECLSGESYIIQFIQ